MDPSDAYSVDSLQVFFEGRDPALKCYYKGTVRVLAGHLITASSHQEFLALRLLFPFVRAGLQPRKSKTDKLGPHQKRVPSGGVPAALPELLATC